MKSFLRRGRSNAFAHRGDRHGRPPGNHAAAIQSAVDLGFDHIETDVHRSADGHLVLFHDDRLDDETTGTGRMHDHRWAQLAELRYIADGEPIDEGLLRFDTALERWPDVHWNVDAKDGEAVEPLLDIIERAGAVDRVLVTSFSLRNLLRIRKLGGRRLATGLSQPEIATVRIASWLGLPVPHLGDAAQIPVEHRGIRIADRRFVQTCHRAGIAVHVWTVNDAAQMHELLDLGVDGIITDEPETLRKVLVERGDW